MASLIWQRSLSSDAANVKTTFSSWDSCMSEAYCKWPVIVGIIIGSLIALSVLFCLFKILCFGAECCFCFASCARCCCSCCRSTPSSRSRDNNYSQQPPPQPYNKYQYQSQPPPMYNNAGPQYARFDAPSGKQGYRGTTAANEDALPAMPSWTNAASRQVEDHSALPEDEGVEMGKLDHDGAKEPMLPKVGTTEDPFMYRNPSDGDLGAHGQGYGANQGRTDYTSPTRSAAGQYPQPSPYGGQTSPTRYAAGPYSQQSPYGGQTSPIYGQQQQQRTSPIYGQQQQQQYISPTYPQRPASSVYAPTPAPQQQQPQSQGYAPYGGARSWQQQQPQMQTQSYEPVSPSVYEPSVAAPSYHTNNPVQSSVTGGYGRQGPVRKPVQGSWRDI